MSVILDVWDKNGAKFNVDSTLEICKPSRQVVVYGFSHCNYLQVMSAIYRTKSFDRVYDAKLSDYRPEDRTTTENRVIDTFCSGNNFKATLVDIVFENFQRKKLGLPLIPVIFCVDIDKNRYPLTPEFLCKKGEHYWTNSELRRAYKLCIEFDDPAIRQAAGETFKFVKLTQSKTDTDAVELQEVDAPWNSKEWDAAWAHRKALSNPRPRKSFWNKNGKTSNWRADLRNKIQGPTPSLLEVLTQKAKNAFSAFASKLKDLDCALFSADQSPSI